MNKKKLNQIKMETTLIKETVKKAYTNVLKENNSGCCPNECCSTDTGMSEDYTKIEGYIPEADYGLGCGIPTQFAGIKEGDTVLDLGSGAGNDVFIAGNVVGEKGKVIGLDMTEAMVKKANANKEKLGFKNIEFILGEIENMQIESNSVDVVLSNCVLNLVPDKAKAYGEIYRVLKPGGHFTISDIVVPGELPEKIKNAAELYAGCISGAMEKDDYIGIIEKKGFKNVKIYKESPYEIPDSILLKYINEEDFHNYKETGARIVSITLSGEK